MELFTLTIACICAASFLCQYFAWKAKLPAILFLLMAGLLAGPVFNVFEPDFIFGDFLFPLVSLSVAIILFEGSLTLKFAQIKGVESVVRHLVTTGAVVTSLVISVAAYFIMEFPITISALFGALVVVTGPTVIVPMLRTVRPNAKVAHILRWEGIIIDPIGALLAVLVYEFIVSSSSGSALSHTMATFALLLGVGGSLGAVVGHALGLVLRHHLLPEYLHNLCTLSLVLVVFVTSNGVVEESGLLAVTVMGIWLANMKDVHVEKILYFKESLTMLLISALFIILAARLNLEQILAIGWKGLLILIVIQCIARPISVIVSTFTSSLSWREKGLLSWIAPRGIVAAAVSALFALKLEQQGVEEAALLVPLTFLVIVGTVVLQSATAGSIAQWLKVAEPEPKGFLIVGANSIGRAIAKALKENGFRAILADTEWNLIKAARMESLDTYYGNVTSEHADQALELVGVGRLMALTPMKEINAMACMRYSQEFGRQNVFSLQTEVELQSNAKHQVAAKERGKLLFGSSVTYASMVRMLSEDGVVKSTLITESFDFNHYMEKHADKTLPLFAIDPKGILHLFTTDESVAVAPGWTLVALVIPQANGDENGQGKKVT
mgnify:CR=1 FL=1